ncbi:hypothetical protein SAZ11_59165 [Streptomyces sp. FXJ1.4098]|nr:hypothetical protein [Streptomyces sp. FXJ1.4098]
MTGIPATLLLEERAELAMNAVVNLADPDLGGIPFFSADLRCDPAVLLHGDWDYGSSHGRLTDACVLARRMTGVSWWSDTESRYKATLLDLLAEDGLTYRRRHPRGHWEPHASLIDQRATLLALTSWYRDSGDETVRRAADRQVAALHRIAVKERDVWYYPASEYTPEGWPSLHAVQLRLAPDPASFCGRLIMPLLLWHRATGNEQALELCGWFTRLITEHSGVFLPDGSFNAALAYRSGHFHTRLGTLDGIAQYAVFTGDHALTAFVRRSFEWALSQCTAFGWTPGDLAGQRFEHETCSLVDLIGIGSTLAQAGHTGYWTVVERFLRNHLTASQLTAVDWVRSAPDRSRDIPGWLTHHRVGERVRGAFAGYGAPNDYVSDAVLGRGTPPMSRRAVWGRGCAACSPAGAWPSPATSTWCASICCSTAAAAWWMCSAICPTRAGSICTSTTTAANCGCACRSGPVTPGSPSRDGPPPARPATPADRSRACGRPTGT